MLSQRSVGVTVTVIGGAPYVERWVSGGNYHAQFTRSHPLAQLKFERPYLVPSDNERPTQSEMTKPDGTDQIPSRFHVLNLQLPRNASRANSAGLLT
jgi:hypothetical protein